MSGHDELLDRLLDVFPGQVFLVARYSNDKLGIVDKTLRIFLPDFHWMSARCLDRYSGGYQFTGNTSRQPTLAALLDILKDLKARPEGFEAFQLGDRFDLWRELTREDVDVRAAYERLRGDAGISGLADRLNSLSATYIRGNHDTWLGEVEQSLGFTEPPSYQDRQAGSGVLFLTHGHRYDNIELLLPATVKAELVGLCPKIKPTTYPIGPFTKQNKRAIEQFQRLRKRPSFPRELYPTVQPDGARPIRSPADLDDLSQNYATSLDITDFFHGDGDRNDFEHISYLTFGLKIQAFEQNHPSDHRVYVIGHTHHARILVDTIRDGPLVVMDCGGWIENCTIANARAAGVHAAPSRQFGVQSGNDLRIYQLGGGIAA